MSSPEINVHADVESRSLLDIGEYGAYRYWEDPSTECLMMAYRIGDGDLQLWDRGQKQPDDLRSAIDAGCVLVAHNAEFEMLAFDWLARNRGWLAPSKYRCTAAMAAALSLPRDLASLGEVLGLDIQKDKAAEEAAERRMLPLSDAEEEVYRLNLTINRRGLRIDVRSAEAALSIAGSSKHIFDHQMAEATYGYVKKCSQSVRLKTWINAQGIPVASTTKADLLSLMETDVPSHVKQAIRLRLAAGKTSVSKLETMLRRASPDDDRVRGAFIYHVASTGRFQSTGVNFANLPRPRKAFEAEQLHVRPARLFAAIRSGDRRMLDLMYGPDLGNPMHLLSDSIRGFIWAAPGKKLVVSDYSGIEGAVIAWLAGEQWKLEAMHEIIANPELPDMYQRTAAQIMGVPVETIGRKHHLRQAVGKLAELGLSFAGAVGAFSAMARNYQVDLDELYEPVMERSESIDVEAARKRYEAALSRREKTTTVLSERAWLASMLITRAWRDTNPAIRQFWWDLEEAVRSAVREPGTTVTVGKVQYRNTHGYLFCRLPSGRCLAYASPRLKAQVYASRLIDGVWAEPEVMDADTAERLSLAGKAKIDRKSFPKVTVLGVDGKTRQFVRFGLYSSILAENCTQATARDILTHGLKLAEAAGYAVIGHVYDEIITEVDRGFGSPEEFSRLICQLPGWAAGLPLTAGGYQSKRYRKD
jgi:DNA polymerase